MVKPVLVGITACVGIAVAVWVAVNPGGRFGMSSGLLTTYDRLPYPLVDLQVRCDGAVRVVGKSHKIGADQLEWLARSEPEVLIIAAGWQGDVRVTGWPKGFTHTKVLTLHTGEALRQFNSLRGQGVRVAIHVHSTC
jgi:hypothetical protein